MLLWWLFPLVLASSWVLTALLRRYALSHRLLDIPNARSSHGVPTPRGGGMAIVIVFLMATAALVLAGSGAGFSITGAAAEGQLADLPERLAWALFGAGAGIALLGFLDDHGHIAPLWRLAGHFAAAGWGLYWLRGLPPLTSWGIDLELGFAGELAAVFYLVWLLNLYNFMDGIDGIASVEAICVCVGGTVALLIAAAASAPPGAPLGPTLLAVAAPAQPALLLAAAIAGFLVWNFPPARIFMGDAGSGFIGIVLGLLSIHAGWLYPSLFWCWLILLGVFIVDATVTLLHRLWRGEKVYEAHRSHAYQFAARRHGGHLPVTMAVLAINLGWLLPLALAVAAGWLDGPTGIAIAYAPLVALAVGYRAGGRELQV